MNDHQMTILGTAILGGLLIATFLWFVLWFVPGARRETKNGIQVFGRIAALWIGMALLLFDDQIRWTFIGAVLAGYLPSILVFLIADGKATEVASNERRNTQS